MNKKWVTIGVLAVIAVGGGYGAYRYFKPKPAVAQVTTGQVQRGDVRKVITATGTVNFPKPIQLSFQKGGKLVAQNVAVGNKVKQGQVLAQLDPTNLAIAVQQAQAKLASDQAKLQQTLDNPNAAILSSLSNAQKNFNSAQESLNTAKQNTDPAYLANQVYLAKQNLQAAGDALAKLQQQNADAKSIQAAEQSLEPAKAALQSALDAQNGGAQRDLAAAQTAFDLAQANLTAAQAQQARQQHGVPNPDVLSAQATVAADQASLASAQSDLDNATLTAPADGVITTVAVQNYQQVNNNANIMTLAAGQDNILQVDAAIDQADINQVKTGQKVDITLDSLPNTHISGTVSLVALQGTTTQNVTTFNVTCQLDAPSPLLHAGMNANVSIIVQEAKNVLVIPSEALRGRMVLVPGAAPAGSESPAGPGNGGNRGNYQGSAGAQGQRSANGGQYSGGSFNLNGVAAHPVPVETGLDDGTNVEIKSGLTEGQEIIVSIRQAATTGSSGGFSLFGGNRGGSSNNAGASMGQLNRAVSGGGGGFRPPTGGGGKGGR